jgi:uncharacterized membrane protein
MKLGAQLYIRAGCHLCEVAEAEVKRQAVRLGIELEVELVDVDSAGEPAELLQRYGERVPVLALGGREYAAPLLPTVLERALRTALAFAARGADATSSRAALPEDAVAVIATHAALPRDALETAGGVAEVAGANIRRLIERVLGHWLLALNAALAVFLAGAFAAPTLALLGLSQPAQSLYTLYHLACHQWAFRSFFLFGAAGVYSEEHLAQLNLDPFTFVGNADLGYKMAICERDVAIYAGLLAVGLLYARQSGMRMRPLGLTAYSVLILPMALDGVTQLFGWRESTWELRVATGLLFGIASAWLLLPRLDAALRPQRTGYSPAQPAKSSSDTPQCHQPSPVPTAVQPRG